MIQGKFKYHKIRINISLIGMMTELNELTHIKHLGEYLVFSKHHRTRTGLSSLIMSLLSYKAKDSPKFFSGQFIFKND